MMEKQEVDRLSVILTAMKGREPRGFLYNSRRYTRGFIRDFATALDIEVSRSEFTTLNRIEAYFDSIREGNQDEPPTFECVGCGGLTEATGLRWDKLNKGQPITVSVDHSGKPRALAWLTNKEIMDNWFNPWTAGNPVIKFRLLSTGRGDSHITFEPVDGPGNTLKFVWQPTQGDEMSAAGELAGNMVCDSSERTFPRVLVHEAGKHEVGHVLGIGHLSQSTDVMFPTARGENKPLSTNDLKERDSRYPHETVQHS